APPQFDRGGALGLLGAAALLDLLQKLRRPFLHLLLQVLGQGAVAGLARPQVALGLLPGGDLGLQLLPLPRQRLQVRLQLPPPAPRARREATGGARGREATRAPPPGVSAGGGGGKAGGGEKEARRRGGGERGGGGGGANPAVPGDDHHRQEGDHERVLVLQE